MWLELPTAQGLLANVSLYCVQTAFSCLRWDKKKLLRVECVGSVYTCLGVMRSMCMFAYVWQNWNFTPPIQDCRNRYTVTLPNSTMTHFSRGIWCSSSVLDTARGSPFENSSWWSRVQSAHKLWTKSEPEQRSKANAGREQRLSVSSPAQFSSSGICIVVPRQCSKT